MWKFIIIIPFLCVLAWDVEDFKSKDLKKWPKRWCTGGLLLVDILLVITFFIHSLALALSIAELLLIFMVLTIEIQSNVSSIRRKIAKTHHGK